MATPARYNGGRSAAPPRAAMAPTAATCIRRDNQIDRFSLAIDVINGSTLLREWVDDDNAGPGDLDELTIPDEQAWAEQRRPYLIY